MSAKDAVLERVGSHHVSDDNYSSRHNGISKEEVFGYFSAKWRGQDVRVTVSADRYAHSSGISDWRVYANEARFYDPERNGGRGEETTGTARAALSKLCSPLMVEWLASDEYKTSFQQAVARMIMRKFRGEYGVSRDVSQALATFKDRLAPADYTALSGTLRAYDDYMAVKAHAEKVISE